MSLQPSRFRAPPGAARQRALRHLAGCLLAGLLGSQAHAAEPPIPPAAAVDWFADDARRAHALLAALARAPEDGLRASAYPVTLLEQRMATGEDSPALGDALTQAYLEYAAALCCGRVRELAGEEAAYAPAAPVPAPALLGIAASLEDGEDLASRLRPASPAYAWLRAALARYRAIAQAGGWQDVPAGPKLDTRAPATADRPQPDPAILALHTRLRSEDPQLAALPAGAPPDRAVVNAALERFQARHGLTVDGVVGPATRRALNVPVDVRIEKLELALERQRWPDGAPADGIEVNIPSYSLVLRQAGQVRLVSKVVVGQPDWATPVFQTQASGVDLHPHWNIPTSIVRAELLAKVRRDPSYLAHQGIEVLEGWGADAAVVAVDQIDWSDPAVARLRFRQRPGPKNPLGRLKFHMPNRYAVFLHDTPARRLFDQDRRALSHGCVRVERAADLAAALLQGADGDGAPPALTLGTTPRHARFPQPVLVRMVYRTAWADAGGEAHFRDDIYGRDRVLARALRGEGLRPAAAPEHNPADQQGGP